MKSHKMKQLLIGTLLAVVAAIPATIFLSQQPQETRSRATASTTLSFAPSTTASAPLVKNGGETVSVDVMLDPGSNLVSVVKLELLYDPTKFIILNNPFTVNTAAFPTTLEGPVYEDGKIVVAVSIGSDSTKVIQNATKVGTLTLTTNGLAVTPTQISFGTFSQALSIAPGDQSNENVLSTTIPAYISILGPTPIPTLTPSPTPIASSTPTLTPTPTAALPTATPPLSGTTLSFTAFLHGIGNSGDNANPNSSDFSNKAPIHLTRDVTVLVYNASNQLTASSAGKIIYSATNGNYTGTVGFGDTLPLGDYTVKIKEPTHLQRLVTGIRRITPQQNNIMPVVTFVAGDVNNDNKLNILDYNLLVGCYSDLLPAVSCNPEKKRLTDINDDGLVNQIDYNLLLREITVQSGN